MFNYPYHSGTNKDNDKNNQYFYNFKLYKDQVVCYNHMYCENTIDRKIIGNSALHIATDRQLTKQNYL